MADFSWSDRLTAFTACLPCLQGLTSHTSTGPIRLPPDSETGTDGDWSLRGLLADSNVEADADADPLSLHLGPGLPPDAHAYASPCDDQRQELDERDYDA
jgi:hypothetical protein